jgi:hypothetical protein
MQSIDAYTGFGLNIEFFKRAIVLVFEIGGQLLGFENKPLVHEVNAGCQRQ